MTNDFAWPATDGGRLGTMSQLQVLSSLPQGECIRFFSIHDTEVRLEEREALMRQVPKLEIVGPVFHPLHLFRYPRYVPRVIWLRTVRGVPYVAGKWDSRAVRAALQGELVAREFDVIWLDGLHIAHYLPLVRSLRP